MVPTVLYDACVLYPAPLRDLLMRLALANLFQARWTDEIQAEKEGGKGVKAEKGSGADKAERGGRSLKSAPDPFPSSIKQKGEEEA